MPGIDYTLRTGKPIIIFLSAGICLTFQNSDLKLLESFGIFRFRGICPHESGNITLALINHMVSPVSSVVYVQV